MPGQWIPDSRTKSGWRWDGDAPPADPTPTNLLPQHPVRDDDLPYGHDDDPDGPPSPPLDVLFAVAPGVGRVPHSNVVACPTCGGGVDPDRIR